jgi:hypothetical protein
MPQPASFVSALFVALITSPFITLATVAQAENIAPGKMLKVTVQPPLHLSNAGYQNSSSLLVSRTGAICVFYPDDGFWGWQVSLDGGKTWGERVRGSEGMLPNACGTYLREGGVIKNIGHTIRMRDGLPMAAPLLRFNDDFSQHEIDVVPIKLPPVRLSPQEPSPHTWAGPLFDKGKMVQLPNGDIVASMSANFLDEPGPRVILSRSTDGGRSWHYDTTIAHVTEDPSPQFPGVFGGLSESTIALMPNGKMICMFRTQGSHVPPDYRPIFVCWSEDLGKTWSDIQPTTPHLLNIWPTVQALDNGVLAIIYGRPGFHMAFSTDQGKTWSNRITFAPHGEPVMTGQVDGIKVGPNRLMAVGGCGPAGTNLFTVDVELVDDPHPGSFTFAGQVLGADNQPVADATVELGPNRYTTDYQPINASNGRPITTTDENGRFAFDNVTRGEAVITVEPSADDRLVPAMQHVKTEPENPSTTITLQAGQIIRGQVVSETAGPMTGACVIVNDDNHVHVDDAGRFGAAIAGELPQSIDVRLIKYGYLQEVRRFNASDRDALAQPMVMHKLDYPTTGPTITVSSIGVAPEQQESIDSETWQRAPLTSDFEVFTDAGGIATPIKARFAYDKKYLYAIFNVQTPSDDEQLFELYLTPDNKPEDAFQFAASSKQRLAGTFGWNSPYVKFEARREADGSCTYFARAMWIQISAMEPVHGMVVGLGFAHAQTTPSDNGELPVAFHHAQLIID